MNRTGFWIIRFITRLSTQNQSHIKLNSVFSYYFKVPFLSFFKIVRNGSVNENRTINRSKKKTKREKEKVCHPSV